jgi:hypothetical protein
MPRVVQGLWQALRRSLANAWQRFRGALMLTPREQAVLLLVMGLFLLGLLAMAWRHRLLR